MDGLRGLPIALLRTRPQFARVLLSRALSAMAGSIYAFAVVWLVYVRTGSAYFLGGAAIAMAVASLAMPFAGALADRVDKRRMLIATEVCNAAACAVLLALALPARLPIVPAYACAFLVAAMQLMGWTAVHAAVPQTVDSAELAAANGLLETATNAIAVGGPALAGVLVGVMGPALVFAVPVGCFAAAALAMRSARLPPPPATTAQGAAALLAEVREGIRYVLASRLLVRLTLLISVLNLAAAATAPMVLWLLQQRLHMPPGEVGVVFALQIVGSLGSSLSFPWLGRRLDRATGAMLGGAAFSVALAVWALAGGLALALLASTLSGFATGGVNLFLRVLRQETVPAEILGRTLGSSAMLGRLVGIVAPALGVVVVAGPGLAALFVGSAAVALAGTAAFGPGLRQRPAGRGPAVAG